MTQAEITKEEIMAVYPTVAATIGTNRGSPGRSALAKVWTFAS